VGAIPFFCLFLVTSGVPAIIALLGFGFCLWATFSVAVAMGHELLPQNVGLASGVMLGFTIGFGGLGVAVNGLIADHYSLQAALVTIPFVVAIAIVLMALLPYPWKSLQRYVNS
jgi:FSR family fosmidomycin resistance protein-like MFS transporter